MLSQYMQIQEKTKQRKQNPPKQKTNNNKKNTLKKKKTEITQKPSKQKNPLNIVQHCHYCNFINSMLWEKGKGGEFIKS